MKNYEKWDRHNIGKIAFINRHYDHPHRKVFVDYVLSSDVNSIIEVGPGELIEYQQIRKSKPIEYAIVDVSDIFINNCKKLYPEVGIIRSPIEDVKSKKVYDVVYAASLLEHSKDIVKCIDNLMRLGKVFHFVMFKWSYSGGLKSSYNTEKGYWSTSFNIRKLMKEINKRGNIEYASVACRNKKIVDFEKFSKGKKGDHRSGDYLMIHGQSKL